MSKSNKGLSTAMMMAAAMRMTTTAMVRKMTMLKVCIAVMLPYPFRCTLLAVALLYHAFRLAHRPYTRLLSNPQPTLLPSLPFVDE